MFTYSNIPIFNSTDSEPNFNLKPFLRAVALVSVKNTDKFVVYDRRDGMWRFPGGHVEEGEEPKDAAIRETLEEVGLQSLDFVNSLGFCRLFYPYKKTTSHVVEVYFLFQTTIKDWECKLKDEVGIYSNLKTPEEIKRNSWKQTKWIFKKLSDFTIK
jgi:8-oxo-dGTP pyrophosphatase MutT (NUDIX family)